MYVVYPHIAGLRVGLMTRERLHRGNSLDEVFDQVDLGCGIFSRCCLLLHIFFGLRSRGTNLNLVLGLSVNSLNNYLRLRI